MPRQIPPFEFKQFKLAHDRCAHRIGTDGILLGAWLHIGAAQQLLEFGHGCGLISFMLAQHNPQAQITGVEIDSASYQQSIINLAANPFRPQIQFLEADFLAQNWSADFDFIFSNPPFFTADVKSPQIERARARSSNAERFRAWIKAWHLALKDYGRLGLILPPASWDFFKKDFENAGFSLERICAVRHHANASVSRLLLQLGKEKHETGFEEELILYRDATSQIRSAPWQSLASPYLLDQSGN